jgi:hypothetical protein
MDFPLEKTTVDNSRRIISFFRSPMSSLFISDQSESVLHFILVYFWLNVLLFLISKRGYCDTFHFPNKRRNPRMMGG